MVFVSKEDVCCEFKLDSRKSVEEILKDLTAMQVKIHPESNIDEINSDKELTDEEKELFVKISDAKKFLRKDLDITDNEKAMIPMSEFKELISLFNKSEREISKKEAIENKIENASERIFKTAKTHWRPAKITATSITALLTVIWSVPSVVTEHPIFSEIITYDFYYMLTALWGFALYLCVIIWFYTCSREFFIKRILISLKNEDTQFHMFSSFMRHFNGNSFTSKDIEEHISGYVIENLILKNNRFKGKKYKYKDPYKFKKSMYSNRIFLDIKDIIPEISRMIIARAEEKGVIVNQNKHSWYDNYIFNNVD